MEFKRIEEVIERLEKVKQLNLITEDGLKFLEELKLILSICSSSIQLKENKAQTFELWCEINGYEELDCGNFYKNQEVYGKHYVSKRYNEYLHRL